MFGVCSRSEVSLAPTERYKYSISDLGSCKALLETSHSLTRQADEMAECCTTSTHYGRVSFGVTWQAGPLGFEKSTWIPASRAIGCLVEFALHSTMTDTVRNLAMVRLVLPNAFLVQNSTSRSHPLLRHAHACSCRRVWSPCNHSDARNFEPLASKPDCTGQVAAILGEQ